MTVTTRDELLKAVRNVEAEIIVGDGALARRVRLWLSLRVAASIAAYALLLLAVFAWADPLHIFDGIAGTLLWARRGLLVLGVLLLFVEELLPVAKSYKLAGSDVSGLRLVRRRAS